MGNGNPLQYSCLENPMDSMKRQKRYNTGKGASPGWKVCNMLLGKSGEQLLIAPERNKWLGQSENDAHFGMLSGDESKFQCRKEQYCVGIWNVRFMNQGKLDVIKQEMAKVNVDIIKNH